MDCMTVVLGLWGRDRESDSGVQFQHPGQRDECLPHHRRASSGHWHQNGQSRGVPNGGLFNIRQGSTIQNIY